MIQIEATEQKYYLLHELLLRGMMAKDPLPPEYARAFDEFVDYSPVGDRIGDQPENIREVWEEFLESSNQRNGVLE